MRWLIGICDAKELFCIPPIEAFADEPPLLVLLVGSEGVSAEAHEFARVQSNGRLDVVSRAKSNAQS